VTAAAGNKCSLSWDFTSFCQAIALRKNRTCASTSIPWPRSSPFGSQWAASGTTAMGLGRHRVEALGTVVVRYRERMRFFYLNRPT